MQAIQFEGQKAMEADIIITISLVTAFVMFVNQAGRIIRSNSMHRTIRDALSRDSNLTPELLDRIDEGRNGGFGDSRTGLILVALSAAMIVYGLIQGDSDDIRNLASMAVFPLFVGAALLGRVWYLARRGAVS
jgi:hypothetical protein